jgi:hypothetical protein
MERKFEADTREEANRKADDWWTKAKGVRFIHRSQIPASFGIPIPIILLIWLFGGLPAKRHQQCVANVAEGSLTKRTNADKASNAGNAAVGSTFPII